MHRFFIVFFLIGCTHAAPTVVLSESKPSFGCLQSLPPPEEPVEYADFLGRCPPPFEVCLDLAAARRLAGNLERTRSYLREVVINCYAPVSSTDAGTPSSEVSPPVQGACYLSSTPAPIPAVK